MSKDTNTVLLVGGGLLAAYLFMPEKVKDAIGGGGTTLGLDLSGLLAGLNLGGGLLGKAGGAAAALEDEAENIVQYISDPSIPEGFSLIPDWWLDQFTDQGESDQPQAEGEGEGGLVERVRQKVATPAAVTTAALAAYATRGITKVVTSGATTTLTTVAPKLAATSAAKVGLRFVPIVGQLYFIADLATTVWELVSGGSVLGSWLGWGELIRGDVTEQAGAMGDIIPQPTGTIQGTPSQNLPYTTFRTRTVAPEYTGGTAPAESMGYDLPIPSLSPATIAALGGVPV